jgi:hypothetical protein
MSGEKEHQVIRDLRELRGYDESVPTHNIYQAEALRLSLLGPDQRAAGIRDFDNRVHSYEENSNDRQKMQAHRFRSYLRHSHEQLRKAGR